MVFILPIIGIEYVYIQPDACVFVTVKSVTYLTDIRLLMENESRPCI